MSFVEADRSLALKVLSDSCKLSEASIFCHATMGTSEIPSTVGVKLAVVVEKEKFDLGQK